jgi:uncharacterized membrane protein YpjA
MAPPALAIVGCLALGLWLVFYAWVIWMHVSKIWNEKHNFQVSQ